MSILDLTLDELHELYNDPLPPVPIPEPKPFIRNKIQRGWHKCKECGERIYVVPRTEKTSTQRSRKSDPICPYCHRYFDGDKKTNHYCVNIYKEEQV